MTVRRRYPFSYMRCSASSDQVRYTGTPVMGGWVMTASIALQGVDGNNIIVCIYKNCEMS